MNIHKELENVYHSTDYKVSSNKKIITVLLKQAF